MAERSRVTFPVIGDDEVLKRDTRIIFTNEQLITRNPSLKEESAFDAAQKPDKKRSEQFTPYNPKVSYATQHRPLSANHSGVSSFDKMPKRTSVDKSKEQAKREAATIPPRPKQYVSPLDRNPDHVSVKRSMSANLTKNNRPAARRNFTSNFDSHYSGQGRNDNPIQDMKRRGMNISDAVNQSGQKLPPQHQQPSSYFENKRKNLFDRGIV